MRKRVISMIALASIALLAGSAVGVAAQDGEPDPLTFTRSVFQGDGKSRATGIAALPTGEILVVGGGAGRRSQGWLSTDGGKTWSRNGLGMPKPRKKRSNGANDVIEWNGGFVVVGSQSGGRFDHGLVLMSPDGVTWTDPIMVKRARFSRIQATPDGLLILGHETEVNEKHKDGDVHHPAVFTSADGMSWERHRVETAHVGGPKEDSGLLTTSDAARSASGIWLVSGIHQSGGIPGFIGGEDAGDRDNPEPQGLLWRSEDGVSWTPMHLPLLAEPGADPLVVPRAIAWTPSGFVLALGPDGRSGGIWHSRDGLSWEQVADDAVAWTIEFAVDGQRVIAFTVPGLVPGDDLPIWADEPAPVLQTTDGRTWIESLADLDGFVDRATVSSDGRIVALGREAKPGTSAFEGAALIWVGAPS